jgi:ABC-2 type transport system ATP-binding protein
VTEAGTGLTGSQQHDRGSGRDVNGITPQLLLLVPLVLIELGLAVWALYDLTRPGRRVRGESRLMWGLIVVLASLLGPILYFVVGRQEGTAEAEERPAWPAAPPAGAPPASPSTGSPTDAPPLWPARAPGATGAPVAAPAESSRSATHPVAAPAIACRGLTKRYPGDILALDGLDLVVPSGSVFGLLGPNGAGKTTTLRLLAGLAHPTAGTATVAGYALGADGLTGRIGFLDQDPRYYGWATGNELVMFVGLLHGMSGSTLEARTGEVMAQVGLTHAADRRVATYSGGMRQRLGIAQALVNRPSVLILYEPVSSLDPEGRRDLLALIAELRGSATVLFSTHVLADVERVCDRVGILDRGRLVTEGPLSELLDRHALPIYRVDPEPDQAPAVGRLVEALRVADWTTDVTAEHGTVRVTVRDPGRASRELLPAIVAAELAVAGVERVRPTLEDVFLNLTGDRDGVGSDDGGGHGGAGIGKVATPRGREGVA